MKRVTTLFNPKKALSLLLLLWLGLPCMVAAAPEDAIRATDDAGHVITLPRNAQRIISLAPSITELLYAAGAGDKIVGAVAHSDFPPQARKLPVVGSYEQLDYERILSLKPDLVIAWPSGNGAPAIARLQELRMTIYQNETKALEDISRALRNLGLLAGTSEQADQTAREFELRLRVLQKVYAQRKPVRVFYQIWNQPLYTVNGQHFISKVIELCGGENVFAGLPAVAPVVGLEAVIEANPQAIIASGMHDQRPTWLDDWRKWNMLAAVKNRDIYHLNADLINRPTPRILQAADEMCRILEQVRSRQSKGGA
ncbi:MAG: cobalamin-binding protein [Pseudomonadota bacterium]